MKANALRRMPQIWPRRGQIVLALAVAGLGMGYAAELIAQDSPSAGAAAPSLPNEAWEQDLAAWRAAREQEIAAPTGWLTLVGMDWLKTGINSVGTSADNAIRPRANAPEHIGLLTVNGKTVQLLAPAGGFPADLLVDGAPAREGGLDASAAKPPIIAWHGLTLAVLARGERFALRIKDSDAAARTSFHGLNWYAPDPKFRVAASAHSQNSHCSRDND